jgi:predicted transcriptional regulator
MKTVKLPNLYLEQVRAPKLTDKNLNSLTDRLSAPKRRSYARETVPVTVRLDLDLSATIELLAEQIGVSRSRIVQAALMEALPALEITTKKIASTKTRAKGRATT